LEKNKFEFQKLELPMKAIYQDDSSELIEKNTKKVSNIGFCLIIGIICGILGYGLSLLTNSTSQKPITTKKAILAKKSVVQSKKPTFFNYYDSILFLNQVHGKKKSCQRDLMTI
jgi:hypothetical protein